MKKKNTTQQPGVIPAEEGNGQVIAPTPPEATEMKMGVDFVRLGYRKNPVIGQIAKDYNLSDHDFNVYMEAALSTLNHSGRNLAENFKYLIEAVDADLTSK